MALHGGQHGYTVYQCRECAAIFARVVLERGWTAHSGRCNGSNREWDYKPLLLTSTFKNTIKVSSPVVQATSQEEWVHVTVRWGVCGRGRGGMLGGADHPVVLLGAGLGLGGGGGPGRPVGVHEEFLGQVHVAGLGSSVALATEPRQTPPPPVVPAHLGMCHSGDTGPRGRRHRRRSQIRYVIRTPILITTKCQFSKRSYTRAHKGREHKGDRQWSA